MLKLGESGTGKTASMRQPPSGGCVLKQKIIEWFKASKPPAAFGRLCVETEAFCYLAA